jgi:hypothetical protein
MYDELLKMVDLMEDREKDKLEEEEGRGEGSEHDSIEEDLNTPESPIFEDGEAEGDAEAH